MSQDTMRKKQVVQPGTIPAPEQFSIKIIKDGPYEVHGAPKLQQQTIRNNESGHSWEYEPGTEFPLQERARLCRCGTSKAKPFCDGSHNTAKVDLTETASFEPLLEHSEAIEGPTTTLTDNERYCAFARFCDNGQRVWNEVQMKGKEHEELTKHMVHRCPGGRLLVWDNVRQVPIEEKQDPEIGLIEDPTIGASGPMMVSGGVPVESAEGKCYEVRTRQALCRCGFSSNKPFCDGTHASAKFHDGL